MSKTVIAILYLLLMAGVIVGMDFAFFRHHFWQRLIANIGTVLIFVAFYWTFLRHK